MLALTAASAGAQSVRRQQIKTEWVHEQGRVLVEAAASTDTLAVVILYFSDEYRVHNASFQLAPEEARAFADSVVAFMSRDTVRAPSGQTLESVGPEFVKDDWRFGVMRYARGRSNNFIWWAGGPVDRVSFQLNVNRTRALAASLKTAADAAEAMLKP